MPEITATDEDLAEAIAEAEQAQKDFLQLEHDSLHAAPPDRPDIAVVTAAAAQSELSARRVDVVRKRVEASKAAARLAALEQVGTEIDQLAAEASSATGIPGAVNAIAVACAQLRAACQEHDDRVRMLHDRAAVLVSEPGRPGPRASSAYVVRAGNGAVRHRGTLVQATGDGVRRAIELACAGDVPGALTEVSPVVDKTPPAPSAYYRDVLDGVVTPSYGPPYRALEEMIRSGRMVQMTPEEVSSWQQSR